MIWVIIGTLACENSHSHPDWRNSWQEVFRGELDLLTYAKAKRAELPFKPPPGVLTHGVLTLPGGVISGGDSMDGDYPIRDTAYSLLYNAESVADARECIARLVAGGGEETMKFEEASWGGFHGQVFDRFGVMWNFNSM